MCFDFSSPLFTKNGVQGLASAAVRVARLHGEGIHSHGIAKFIGDGVAAVAAKIAAGDLDAGGSLTAFIFRDIEQMLDLFDHIFLMAFVDNIRHRHFLFDKA